MAIIRYPGSKAKLFDAIQKFFPDAQRLPLWSHSERMEYREPFFGSGEVGFRIMRTALDRKCSIWLNDVDPGIVALWRSVQSHPRRLCIFVQEFTPSVDAFYRFKAEDGISTGDEVEDGFRKLALHRMSVSGFGVKSGGPIGGRNQTNATYTVDCRWTPSRIKRDIASTHRLMAKFSDLRITCGDFRKLIETAHPNCFQYIDPPYFEKGGQLYKFNMSPEDHEDLAARLRVCPGQWVLSYDDHPRIRELYSWATAHELHVTYSNAICKTAMRPKNREIVIVPKS